MPNMPIWVGILIGVLCLIAGAAVAFLIPFVRQNIVKNKVSPPFKQCEIDIIYGQGISKEGEILDRSVELGLIKKAGSWFEYNGSKIAQGRDAAKAYLKENEDVANELLEKIKTGVVTE